ncbi:MAG: DUF11 domain-containing protein, partial [Clostridia bacterium]|nr:DUF11 domain-containing protein [Clostridia bacterium]
MKESEDYRSKKALAIGAGIAAAVVVAVGGTVAFIKSRPASTAVNNVVENQITNSATANETNSTQNISINNEVTNTSTNSTSNDGNTISNTTANNTTNSNSTNIATNNASNNNSKPSATAQTGTNNNKNTNQTRLEEFVQSTVIEGKKNVKVYDERDVQWSPLALSAISGAFELNKSHIYSTKFAYINGIVMDTQESYVAHEGDEITYVIKVVNSGKKTKNNINAYDSVPKGTSLVADSITNNGVEKNGKISWKVSVEAGKTVELSFKVKVNKEITVVKNQATVNGEPTNEVKTPIVTSDKEVQVLDNEGNVIEGASVASAGQTLLYTIRVRNTSDVEGKANITDTIDDKALTVDAASITEGGNYSKGTITWNNVSVPANNRAKLQFKATVNAEGEFSLVSNKAEVNGTPTNEVETPIVTSEKQVQVLDNEGNVIEGVTTASAGQTLLYTIRVKNTSNVNGIANISDTIDTNALTVHTSSMTEGGNYSDGIVSWNNITIPANGKAKLQFQATIKAEGEFNVVSNKAEVNDIASNEVKTPIITSDKEVQVLDSEGNIIEGVTTASAGQTLLYTIRVRNSSEVEGTADVSDTIDPNVLVVDSASITGEGNYSEGKVTWDNVTVPANDRAKLQFKAVVNAESEFNLVTNKAKVNGEPTNEVKTPIVTSTKEVQVLDSKGNIMEGVTTAMPGQTLLYTIRVFNTSEVEGKANIVDSIDTAILTVDESTITEG